MNSMLVSVIVPVYNCEKYLSECIHSITAQSHSSLQIILVDDGSTDNSSLICDELATVDDRIEVLHLVNRGVSVARNDGYRLARGEWVLFVDADDEIKPNAVERMLSLGADADIIAFGVDAVNEDGSTIWSKIPRDIKTSDEKSLVREIVQGPLEEFCVAYLFRREAIVRTEWGDGFFVEGCGLYEDAWSLHRLLRSGSFRVAYLPESLYLYRQVAGSAMHRYNPNLAEDGLRAIEALSAMSVPADMADSWHARLLLKALGVDGIAGPGLGDGQRDLHTRIAKTVVCQARMGGLNGLGAVGKLKYLAFRLGLYRPMRRARALLKGSPKD